MHLTSLWQGVVIWILGALLLSLLHGLKIAAPFQTKAVLIPRHSRERFPRAYRFYLLPGYLSLLAAGIIAVYYLPGILYHVQQNLYSDAQTLAFIAPYYYPFYCVPSFFFGIWLWSIVLKLLCRLLAPRFHCYQGLRAFVFSSTYHLSKSARTRLKRRLWGYGLTRLNLEKIAALQWRTLLQAGLFLWLIGGLFLLLGMNHYVRITQESVVVNPFWELNEVHHPYDTLEFAHLQIDIVDNFWTSPTLSPLLELLTEEKTRIVLWNNLDGYSHTARTLENTIQQLEKSGVSVYYEPLGEREHALLIKTEAKRRHVLERVYKAVEK